MKTALPQDIADFARVAADRLAHLGGPPAALRAETDGRVRVDARAALTELGAFELDVRAGADSGSDELLAAAVLCQAAGATALPYGYGVHPYFEFGDLTEVELLLPFDDELAVDAERLLPIEVRPVSGERDFRRARRLADTEFDTAFCSPISAEWAVDLRGPEHGVRVWGDESVPWVQVYTTRPDRHAVAVEPMTCGPDAFNPGPTHADVVVLPPGASWRGTWGIRAV